MSAWGDSRVSKVVREVPGMFGHHQPVGVYCISNMNMDTWT